MPNIVNEVIEVKLESGVPTLFEWRDYEHEVKDVIGHWRIEGRWWQNGKGREYWRVKTNEGTVFDIFSHKHDDSNELTWQIDRMWD